MEYALAAAGAIVGTGLGWLTNRLNVRVMAGEPEAPEPALRREELWAPVLDAALLAIIGFRYGLGLKTLWCVVLAVLLVQVLGFDARHPLILNKVIYPAIVVAFLTIPVNPLLHGGLGDRAQSAVLGAL